MGPRLKLPRYVHGFLDRHGKPRFYFRRPGFESKRLRGLPYSPEFMADYHGAMADQPLSVGLGKTRPGAMLALAISYFASPAFSTLRPTTQQAYRGMIDRLCRDHGDKRAADLRREHVIKLMAARAKQPGAANSLRMALRVMMKHAVDIGLRSDDPTRDVKAIRVKTEGFHSWTDPEIEQFERCHPIGTRARLAFALLLYTGQRRGDVIRMGAQHVRNGAIHVKQAKTGAELVIPVHPELEAIIASTPRGHLTFLTTKAGVPFDASVFSHWFRDQSTRPDYRVVLPMACARLRRAVWPRPVVRRTRSEPSPDTLALRKQTGCKVCQKGWKTVENQRPKMTSTIWHDL